jgi:hypothetical protein
MKRPKSFACVETSCEQGWLFAALPALALDPPQPLARVTAVARARRLFGDSNFRV